jgi:hypothetical protein
MASTRGRPLRNGRRDVMSAASDISKDALMNATKWLHDVIQMLCIPRSDNFHLDAKR